MLEKLLEIGFLKIGEWVEVKGQIKPRLSKYEKASPALYAFVYENQIMYIGKTTQTLSKRLYFYGKPGASQKTNIRINSILKTYISEDRIVEIYGFHDPSPDSKGAFLINLPAALEDDIIKKAQPIWNVRR